MIELLALAVALPFLWAGTPDDGYHKVWLIEMDDINWCNHQGYFAECYIQDSNGNYTIQIVRRLAFSPDMYNCNTNWDHGYWHAMGYEHGEKPLVIC